MSMRRRASGTLGALLVMSMLCVAVPAMSANATGHAIAASPRVPHLSGNQQGTLVESEWQAEGF